MGRNHSRYRDSDLGIWKCEEMEEEAGIYWAAGGGGRWMGSRLVCDGMVHGTAGAAQMTDSRARLREGRRPG